MKKKTISFLLFFASVSLFLPGAQHEKTDSRGKFFSLDRLTKGFRLNSIGNEQRSLFFLDESDSCEMRRKIELDAFCSSLLDGENKIKAQSQPKNVRSKKFGRALLVNAGLWLADSIRYWATYAMWIEDWQFELKWKDQKIRFTSLKANKFDSNPFVTNWTHGLSGATYYTMARYHRLNILESLLFELGSSFWWEYVTEWREVISVNDNFFSGIGGLPIGESLFRLGNYFVNKPGALNKVLGYVFNPVMGLNDLLGGKKWRKRFAGLPFSKSCFDLYFGQKQVSFKGDKGWSSPLFYIGFETSLNTIPGYGNPDNGDSKRFIKEPIFSELCFDSTFGADSVEEYNFLSRVVIFGFFSQRIKQDSSNNLRGYSFYLGTGSAFDLFKKKAVAYYDKGQYHYDFTGEEQATQPTEFTDKLAIINLIGPVLDLSLYAGRFKFWLSLGAYVDFALVNSMAINEYSTVYDLYNPRMKTTLSHYGYYYAFGYTLAAKGSVIYKNFEISGRLKYQYYDSIEGLDRFQDRVVDDCNVSDYRMIYKVSVGYSISESPVKIVFACEGIDRKGSIKDTTHRESETRLYTQLKFSF